MAENGTPVIRIARMETLGDVRGELAKLYRHTRLEQIACDRSRTCNSILNSLMNCIRETSIEQQLAELREMVEKHVPK